MTTIGTQSPKRKVLVVASDGYAYLVESQIREAIAFHVEGLREDGLPVPPGDSQVEYVDVPA